MIGANQGLSNQLAQLRTWVFAIIGGKFFDSLQNEFFLFADDGANLGIVDIWMHMALHHGAALVVLDVSSPPLGRHAMFFSETLFPEIAQSQVVSVCHHVFHLPALHLLWIYPEIPFNLFINRVPKPFICYEDVIAKKAISAKR